ncbi:MAG: hypothetical protein ACKOTF_10765, partial [Opitutaceae bacterium]
MNSPLPIPARSAGRLLRASLLSAAALSTGLLPLNAQSASAPKGQGEVVKLDAVVTAGTRFNPRTVTESIVPIDVLTNVDL